MKDDRDEYLMVIAKDLYDTLTARYIHLCRQAREERGLRPAEVIMAFLTPLATHLAAMALTIDQDRRPDLEPDAVIKTIRNGILETFDSMIALGQIGFDSGLLTRYQV